ncbi:DUF6538 domain-containing protein [Bradyrhizobium sp. STM 3562]|uniref:DUF6538 domain-containing protein n=1 Tax=Bradyrhizobium sp. STM 3562 TaxID=578924 RepID=UPI00389036DB
MSRPWKHPKTGIYQLRKAVPENLRKLIGKREEKLSLQTRDPVEAKQRFAKALADLETRWANLRAGPKPLSELEAHQLAIVAHDQWLEQYRDNPSQQTNWDVQLGHRLFGPRKTSKEILAAAQRAIDLSAPRCRKIKYSGWSRPVWKRRTATLLLTGSPSMIRTAGRWLARSVQRCSVRVRLWPNWQGGSYPRVSLPAPVRVAWPGDVSPAAASGLLPGSSGWLESRATPGR